MTLEHMFILDYNRTQEANSKTDKVRFLFRIDMKTSMQIL